MITAPTLAPLPPVAPDHPPDAPRIVHNRTLCAAYLKANKVHHRWPRLSEQIETVPFQREKLHPHAYNPTLVDDDGALLLCYRYHDGTPATKLATARIGDGGEVSEVQTLSHGGPVHGSLEDPHFFRLSSGEWQLWMSWVESGWPTQIHCSMRYGALKGNILAESARPSYGKNDGDHMEKNWLFFEQGGRVYFIYRSQPRQVVVSALGQGYEELTSPGPRWPYGIIKGGTTPLPYEGKWLRFFHSRLDNDLAGTPHRYFVGAALMNAEPPFETIRVSRKPILYGSEVDDLSPAERRACPHWKGKVCFPGGAVQRDGYWLLALGENDSACALAKIRPENLHL